MATTSELGEEYLQSARCFWQGIEEYSIDGIEEFDADDADEKIVGRRISIRTVNPSGYEYDIYIGKDGEY